MTIKVWQLAVFVALLGAALAFFLVRGGLAAVLLFLTLGLMVVVPILAMIGIWIHGRRNPRPEVPVAPPEPRSSAGEIAREAVGFLTGLGARVAVVLAIVYAAAWLRGIPVEEFHSRDPLYGVVRVAGGLWIWSFIRRANNAST